MDPGDLNANKDKFDAVWRRVMSESAYSQANAGINADNPDAAEAARLRTFMDDEATDAQMYSVLAGILCGRAHKTLAAISADERRHLKKLRATHFIRTGKTYMPPAACPFIHSVRETLRLKILGEMEGADAYLKAADETGDDALSETYRMFASDEMRHAHLLGEIIESIL